MRGGGRAAFLKKQSVDHAICLSHGCRYTFGERRCLPHGSEQERKVHRSYMALTMQQARVLYYLGLSSSADCMAAFFQQYVLALGALGGDSICPACIILECLVGPQCSYNCYSILGNIGAFSKYWRLWRILASELFGSVGSCRTKSIASKCGSCSGPCPVHG